LTALASLRSGVAAELAREIAPDDASLKTYGNYDDVINDPNVHAVYIPTTGEEHHTWTLKAARAGKHVLCEKSLALNVREAEEMERVCAEQKVLLQEAFMWRHHPRSKQARKLLRDGQIGELRLVCVHFSFDIDRNDWRLDPVRGGGAVWDIGCYGVNASRYFVGEEPSTIYSRARFWPTGVDMTMQIALEFPGGVLANIDCSFEAPFRCEVEVVGTKGTITLPDCFLPPPRAEMKLRKGAEPTDAAQTIQFAEANQYVEQVKDFVASIHASKLMDPGETGVNNMRVLESALNQAKAARR